MLNGGYIKWREVLSEFFLRRDHPTTALAMFGLIWFNGFRSEDVNVKSVRYSRELKYE
jgi:hypothetical protein